MKKGKLSVIVLGSIGYGGIEDIRDMYDFLDRKGFDVIRHVEENGMDYSHVTDFRYEKDLSKKIVQHDLDHVRKADVVIRVHNGRASEGSAIEMCVAKSEGRKVVMLAKRPVPTPWPVHHCDHVVKTKDGLVKTLRRIERMMDIRRKA